MDLFKERLKDSFVVFMIILFLVAIIYGVAANQFWIFGVFMALIIICAAVTWINWLVVEPYKIAKANRKKKGL